MGMDTKGFLLEGVRISNGNNAFTYPPRSVVSNQAAFAASLGRAEYAVLADLTMSASPDVNPFAPFGADIGDPNLRFGWSRNGAAVTRFDFDSFSRRWNTMPGGPPDALGVIGNAPRLIAAVPDLTDLSAPYSLYVGSPIRLVTFIPTLVSDPTAFGNPAAGSVEISKADGSLNFGAADLANPAYAGQTVYQTRQSFFDRTKVKGVIGQVPQSSASSYFFFLNPRPAHGQLPRIRIGFRSYLVPNEVPNEAALNSPPPAAGTFNWSADTGRILMAAADVTAAPGENVYYEGVILAYQSLASTTLGSLAVYPVVGGKIPVSLAADVTTFAVFASPIGAPRYYFKNVQVVGFPLQSPPSGSVYVDSTTGNLYFSGDDAVSVGGGQISYVATALPVENGVSIQLYRSGANVSGPSQVQDFTVRYGVSGQLVQDGIGQSPFAVLPTVPVMDSSLQYSVSPGPGSAGTFSGQLVDARDPTKSGLGYLLNLDQKQLNFTARRQVTITLPKDQSMVSLPDSAVISNGFQATRNGSTIVPGVDFDFNQSAGLMEFITPVGENNSSNLLDVAGTFGTDSFTSNLPVFLPSHAGASLLVQSGPNVGVYPIKTVSSSQVVHVTGAFSNPGPGVVDVRIGAEIVADHFWSSFSPPSRKVSLSRGTSLSGLTVLGNQDFSVLATTGQVTLTRPARPGEIFQIAYTSLDSSDFGVTVTPTPRIEFAGFKVRQEAATTTPGSPNVRFNPAGKMVDTTRPMKVYIDGVTQDSASIAFTAPGTLLLKQPLTTEVVTVDYYVREAVGGETSFNVLFTPVQLDLPNLPASGAPAVFNGDQTGLVFVGTPFLVNQKDVVIASAVSYSAATDVTSVSFEVPPTADTSPLPLQISLPVSSPSFRIPETAPIDPFPQGTNVISLSGNLPYSAGTIVTLDGDPYLVQAAQHDPVANKTSLVTTAPARRNYIIPAVTRTVRPVLRPGTSLTTSKPAHLGYPFTLVRSGRAPAVLTKGVDYVVAEGGPISLQSPTQLGDSLTAFYVGRVAQPAGTSFTLNYAHAVAPSSSNGLLGQRLFSTYNLYQPDTFFFRMESIVSFMPEVMAELQQSAQSNGSSGPNIQSQSSLRTKDFGSPSLYFDEQHLGNLDAVTSRLLKLYNDIANSYEDLLSNLDGRVVGGTSGRFRFDGNLNNPVRTDYSQVTNDIDDQLKLYDSFHVTSLNPFTFSTGPVNAPMWQPSGQSRLFPTFKTITVALNGNVGAANFGKVLGSLNQGALTSVSTMTSSRASANVISVDSTGKVFTVDRNGDVTTMVPQFALGTSVRIYAKNGAPDQLGKVLSITGVGPYIVTLDTAMTAGLDVGSLLQDTSDSTNSLNHFYTPGRDLGVNSDNGQVTNATVTLAALPNSQVPVTGNELVDASVTFLNSDIAPRRIPVLDGSILTDSGRSSSPLLSRTSESLLLSRELTAYDAMGNGTVAAGGTTVTGATLIPAASASILWINGPNVNRTSVVAVPSAGSFTLTSPITPTGSGNDYVVVQAGVQPPPAVVAAEIGVVSSNAASAAVSPALIGSVDSELKNASTVALALGQQVAFGTGTASGNVLTDPLANFSNVVTPGSMILVQSGTNQGLYKLASFTATALTVDPTPPFAGFPSSTVTSYVVVQPWTFLSPKESAFLTTFIQQTTSYLASLTAWQSAITTSGIAARRVAVSARQAQITQYVKSIQGLLSNDDHIYDTRYLWIQQRVDRKQGTLARQSQAASKRSDATAKLLTDQQKLLVVQRITG